MCFLDLEKAYDYVPRRIFVGVLKEYGVLESLLRAIRSLYDQSKNCVCILGTKSNSFVRWTPPGLSPIPFVIFMDRILRRSRGEKSVWFWFAADVVLLASSSHDLQHTLKQYAAECEIAGMTVSSSKSDAMVLNWKKEECSLRVMDESLPQAEEFKYFAILFMNDGELELEMDRQIGASSAVMRVLLRSVVVKRELSPKEKLSVYCSIFVPTLTYGHRSG